MKLTCDEATTICDKSQYNEATIWEKIKLNIHLFLCKKCGLYSKQNTILTTCYDKYKNNNNTKDCLHEEEKKEMDAHIKAKTTLR